MADTLTNDRTGSDWLYKCSGEVTTTVLATLDVSGFEVNGGDCDGDENGDTWFTGFGSKKEYYISGQFTATVNNSWDISTASDFPTGTSVDTTDTIVSEATPSTAQIYSGKFSTTLKSTANLTAGTNSLSGCGIDESNYFWCTNSGVGYGVGLYYMSGKVTTTVLSSAKPGLLFTGVDGASTTADTLGEATKTLYVYSGKITTTVNSSAAIATTGNGYGIGTTDYNGRLNIVVGTTTRQYRFALMGVS